MRTLFAKIFLAFFATVVLLGALLEITAMRTEMRRVDAVFRPMAEQAAARLAAAYEADGPEAVKRELARLPLDAGFFDERGQPVAPLPESLSAQTELLRALISERGDSASSFDTWQNLAIAAVRSASGRRYILAVRVPHERWMAILNKLDEYPALRLSVVGLVAGVICFFLARHITRPIVRLRAAAAGVADGQLETRVGRKIAARHDELGALGRDFDLMAERLGTLVAAERQLLADVSHELRSPLARLTVAVGLARQHLATGPAAGAIGADLDRVELEAGRLDHLIGQSLALARIETGVESGPRDVFDLTNLVQQVAADGDYEARGSGRSVVVTRADACTMRGSIDQVRSAVENVIRNAIRHTPAGTNVEVDLRREPIDGTLAAILHVRDAGPGVAPELLDTIFLPFRRGAASSDGAGLGLAIVDRVVRRHGGQVMARNIESAGFEVRMVLPIGAESAERPLG